MKTCLISVKPSELNENVSSIRVVNTRLYKDAVTPSTWLKIKTLIDDIVRSFIQTRASQKN